MKNITYTGGLGKMVDTIEFTTYACGECHKQYDDFDKAEACCKKEEWEYMHINGDWEESDGEQNTYDLEEVSYMSGCYDYYVGVKCTAKFVTFFRKKRDE